MTQDEIIRSPLGREQLVALAREAGFEPRIEMGVWGGAMHELKSSELSKLKHFAALVAAHEREKHRSPSWETVDDAIAAEREACAKVCDDIDTDSMIQNWKSVDECAKQCAAAIRARGEK